VLVAFLRSVARKASLTVTSAVLDLNGSTTCTRFAERLLEDVSRGHVIVPFWSAHQLTIALLAEERAGLRTALTKFEIVADDSFGGDIMWAIGEGLRLNMRRIHTRGNPQRLEDVGTWLRNPAPFFIAVDGGAEYGTVPTGIVRLATRLESVVWPIGIRVRPALRIPGVIAELPLPTSRIALGIAEPLRFDRTLRVGDAAAVLKDRLDRATSAAEAALDSSTVTRPSFA